MTTLTSAFADLRSNLDADFRRSTNGMTRITVSIFRFGQCVRPLPGISGKVLRRLWKISNLLWTRLLIGADLPWSVECGPGLLLNHAGRGVILHRRSVLGANVVIHHRVTLGQRRGDGGPTVGDGVVIGNGASILGSIRVGDRARIGAHAVVLQDVPAGATAVGVPARIVERAAPEGS